MKGLLSFLINEDHSSPYDPQRYSLGGKENFDAPHALAGFPRLDAACGIPDDLHWKRASVQPPLYGDAPEGGAAQPAAAQPAAARPASAPTRPLPSPVSSQAPRNAGAGAGGPGPPDAVQAGCWLIPQEPAVSSTFGGQRQLALTRSPYDAKSQAAAMVAPTGGYTGDYSEELWMTEWANTEPVISTGAILNPYTGEIAETFESAIPPPDRRGGDQAREMKSKQLRLDWATGGQKQMHVRKDLEQPLPSADSGPISTYQTGVQSDLIKLEALHRGERGAYGNRDDELLQLPQLVRNPYGHRGFQNMIRPRPIPATTNQLDNAGYLPTQEVVGTSATLKPKQRLRKEMFYGSSHSNDGGAGEGGPLTRYGAAHSGANPESATSEMTVRKSDTGRNQRQNCRSTPPSVVSHQGSPRTGEVTVGRQTLASESVGCNPEGSASGPAVHVASADAVRSSLGLGFSSRSAGGSPNATSSGQPALGATAMETTPSPDRGGGRGGGVGGWDALQYGGGGGRTAEAENPRSNTLVAARAPPSAATSSAAELYGQNLGGAKEFGEPSKRRNPLVTWDRRSGGGGDDGRGVGQLLAGEVEGTRRFGESNGAASAGLRKATPGGSTKALFDGGPVANIAHHRETANQRGHISAATSKRLGGGAGEAHAGSATFAGESSEPKRLERLYGDANSVARSLATSLRDSSGYATGGASEYQAARRADQSSPLSMGAVDRHSAADATRTSLHAPPNPGKEAASVLSKSLTSFAGPSAHTTLSGEVTKIGGRNRSSLAKVGNDRGLSSPTAVAQSAERAREFAHPLKTQHQTEGGALSRAEAGWEAAIALTSEVVVCRKSASDGRNCSPTAAGTELATGASTLRSADPPPVFRSDKSTEYAGVTGGGTFEAASAAREGVLAPSLLDNRGKTYIDRQPGFERIGGDVVLPIRAPPPAVAKVPTFDSTPAPRMERNDELLSHRSPPGAQERSRTTAHRDERRKRHHMPERAHRPGVHGLSEPLECSSEEDYV